MELDPQHGFLESKKYNCYINYRLFSREEVRKAAEITRKELGEVRSGSLKLLKSILTKKVTKIYELCHVNNCSGIHLGEQCWHNALQTIP